MYDGIHDAVVGWDRFFEHMRERVFGFHPPGEYVVDFIGWRIWSALNPNAADPIGFALSLAFVGGGVTLFALAMAARRVAGLAAGAITIAALSASFVVNDTRVSGQGEAFFYPFVAVSVYFLVRALEPKGRHVRRDLLVAALFALLASFFRSELIFLLPGLCLMLWALVGFRNAFLFGLVACIFSAIQTAYPYVSGNTALTFFNAHSLYFTPERSLADLFRTPFVIQLVTDPTAWFVIGGAVSTLLFLVLGARRRNHDWRVVATLGFAVALYVVIISIAIVNELTTHNSYRLAMPAIHLLVPVFAISAVRLFQLGAARIAGGRGTSAGRPRAMIGAGVVASLAIVGSLSYSYLGPQLTVLKTRGLDGLTEAIAYTRAHMTPGETVFIDMMRYWEGLVPAYYADRTQPVCLYSVCDEATEAAKAAWDGVRTDKPAPGAKSTAEYTALRSHVFIRDYRPRYILLPEEKLHTSWVTLTKRLRKEEWQVWYSHIDPYLLEPLDYANLQDGVFLKLGTIDGRKYFESYVYLVPEFRTENIIVMRANYDRRPDDAQP